LVNKTVVIIITIVIIDVVAAVLHCSESLQVSAVTDEQRDDLRHSQML